MEVAEHQPTHDRDEGRASSGNRPLDGQDGCQLFAWLWGRLSAVLGTPSAAALMRRAISVAGCNYPILHGIAISRDRLTYIYNLPEELCTGGQEAPVPAYRALIKEVLSLTGELTCGIMVRGLVKSPELAPWLPDIQEVDKWLTSEE
ncbi:MAG TPA: hypothetical protein VHS06_09185 [Chloroflexota bacterium]|nr:hypothetical protein [Chloroflexota bacterium]